MDSGLLAALGPGMTHEEREEMAKLRLTIASGDYDIIRPLKEGLVEAAGIELIFLTDMGPRERHWRLARKSEFDICEENVGAYFIAREQGHAITGIPVFVHRRDRKGAR